MPRQKLIRQKDKDILAMRAKGFSYSKIAGKFGMSTSGVKKSLDKSKTMMGEGLFAERIQEAQLPAWTNIERIAKNNLSGRNVGAGLKASMFMLEYPLKFAEVFGGKKGASKGTELDPDTARELIEVLLEDRRKREPKTISVGATPAPDRGDGVHAGCTRQDKPQPQALPEEVVPGETGGAVDAAELPVVGGEVAADVDNVAVREPVPVGHPVSPGEA